RDGPAVRSEQTGLGVVDAAQRVVVEGHAVDAAIGGEHARLRLDGLGGEDAAHRGEQRVPVQQLEVAGELLDPVDLAAALDLDRDRASRLVAREDVHRADRGEVLAAHQRPALAEGVDVLREQGLEVGLDAVLLQARVDPEIVGGVLEHLDQAHPQPVTGLVVHDVPLFDPLALGVLARLLVAAARGGQRARRGHPVQRLVAAAVGMDQHAAVGLDDQQLRCEPTWAPEPETTATADLSDAGPAVVIDPGVLYVGGQEGELVIEGASDVSVITAGGGDIDAYLEEVHHTRVTGASDWTTLSTEEMHPDGEDELADPTSSDLWRTVDTAPSPYTLDIHDFWAGENDDPNGEDNEQP